MRGELASANTFLKHERRPLTTVIHTERVLGVWMMVDWNVNQIACPTSYPSVHARASFLRLSNIIVHTKPSREEPW